MNGSMSTFVDFLAVRVEPYWHRLSRFMTFSGFEIDLTYMYLRECGELDSGVPWYEEQRTNTIRPSHLI